VKLFRYVELRGHDPYPDDDAWITWFSMVLSEGGPNYQFDCMQIKIPWLAWRDTKHRTPSDDITSGWRNRRGFNTEPVLIGWCRPILRFHWDRHLGVTERLERSVYWEPVKAETHWLSIRSAS
jgi:hypothetical protein